MACLSLPKGQTVTWEHPQNGLQSQWYPRACLSDLPLCLCWDESGHRRGPGPLVMGNLLLTLAARAGKNVWPWTAVPMLCWCLQLLARSKDFYFLTEWETGQLTWSMELSYPVCCELLGPVSWRKMPYLLLWIPATSSQSCFTWLPQLYHSSLSVECLALLARYCSHTGAAQAITAIYDKVWTIYFHHELIVFYSLRVKSNINLQTLYFRIHLIINFLFFMI